MQSNTYLKEAQLARLNLVKQAEKIVVITGAGISAPSGLLTFRGKDNSLWNDKDFVGKCHIDYVQSDPEHVEELWNFWGPMRDSLEDVEPNDAHYALVKAEQNHTIIIGTQNVDGLHQKAGSTNVYEFHGTLLKNKCVAKCIDDLSFPSYEDTCPICEGQAMPAILLFGEVPNLTVLELIEQEIKTADIFMMIGTSGMVYPVAGFIDIANTYNVPAILVNDQEWDYPHPGFQQKILGPCEEILPIVFGV